MGEAGRLMTWDELLEEVRKWRVRAERAESELAKVREALRLSQQSLCAFMDYADEVAYKCYDPKGVIADNWKLLPSAPKEDE